MPFAVACQCYSNLLVEFLCLAGFPAARRCHSCVQIKNGKDSKHSIFLIVYTVNILFLVIAPLKRHKFGKSLFLVV